MQQNLTKTNYAEKLSQFLISKTCFYIEFTVLIAVFLFTVILFRNGNLDLLAAQAFYHPESSNPWFEENNKIWNFFYYAAPVITAVFLLPSIFVFITSYVKSNFLKYRYSGLFVILIVLVGPGLLINTVFKPGWGRARPRQVIEFGGQKTYTPFWQPTRPNQGMSFPAGHASVGFLIVAAYYLLKRRAPYVSVFAAFASLIFGTMMGVGRIAAGGHFLSDVIISGWIVYTTSFILFYYVLKLPTRPIPANTNTKLAVQFGVAMVTCALTGVLLATPYQNKIEQQWENINEFNLEVDKADITVLHSESDGQVKIEANLKGFGLPNSKVVHSFENHTFKMSRSGPFTDYEAQIKIYLPTNLEKVSVKITQGGGLVANGFPKHYEFHAEKF